MKVAIDRHQIDTTSTLVFPPWLEKNGEMNTKLLTLLAIGLCVAAGLCVANVTTSSSAPPPIPPATQIRTNIVAMLQRKPNVPIKVLPDIPGGARTATNKDAAYYAWQEFIALNWANVPVSGNAAKPSDPGAREFADRTRQFGQPPLASSTSYPALVWESTRHRSEIYTGSSTPPNGYTDNAKVSWGYNSTPGYVYPGVTINPAPSPSPSASPPPPPCTAIKPGLTPFINLDEASQIGLCKMYSGVPYAKASPANFVLFMAKGNYMEYGYIASRGWYDTTVLKNPSSPGSPTDPVASFANTSGYIVTQGEFPAPGALDGSSTTGNYVSFPNGTLEFKAAFRVATEKEQEAYEKGLPIPGGYHVAPIRYYKEVGTNSYQYVDTCGVLLSLHIIHKTPSAPYFIFATFEHKDNVIGTNGKPVEDANGNLNANAFTTATPTPLPSPYVYPSSATAPAGKYLTNATTPNVIEVPSQFNVATKTVTVQNFMPAPNDPGGQKSTTQSSYQNTRNGSTSTLPAANYSPQSESYFSVNRRRFSIPSRPIIEVNQDIHKLIAMYGYNTTSNVWLNYKLVNVQWIPAGSKFQKTPGKLYGDKSSNTKPLIPVESYYLSNSLVETNLELSAFSGQFGPVVANTYDGFSITDFYYHQTPYINNNIYVSDKPQTTTKNVGNPFYNIYTKGGPYNMGGCMGCHGNAGVAGTDASFILKGAPFQPEGIEPSAQAMRLRHQSYFRKN